MGLTPEQRTALIEALENGGRFPDESTGGMWCSLINHCGDFETGFYQELSEVGQALAEECKRADMLSRELQLAANGWPGWEDIMASRVLIRTMHEEGSAGE